jgi:hypothetical protein
MSDQKGLFEAMRAAIIAMMLTFGSQAGADVFDTDFKLRKLASIGVSLYDGATGACWTNLKEVREYAEEKLSMKGAKIDNEAYVSLEANRYNFDIEVIGERLYTDGTGPCYGNVILELYTVGHVNGSVHVISAGDLTHVRVTKVNLNRAVIEKVSQFIAEFK